MTGRPKGSAQPGVKITPLTAEEIGTLLALSEGMTPAEIAAATKARSAQTVWKRTARIRLKLGVFTNEEMMFKVGKEKIIDTGDQLAKKRLA